MIIDEKELELLVKKLQYYANNIPEERMTDLLTLLNSNESCRIALSSWTMDIKQDKNLIEILSHVFNHTAIIILTSYERGYEKGQEDAFRIMIKGE